MSRCPRVSRPFVLLPASVFADMCFEFVSGCAYLLLRLSSLFFGSGEEHTSLGSRKRGHSGCSLVMPVDGSADSSQEPLALLTSTDQAAILPRSHFGLKARLNGYVCFYIAVAKQFLAMLNAHQSQLNRSEHVEYACSAV